jgi:aerobic-type carbon monoxide dehydrogenase small subunit (CoxS/CutS family)
MLMSAKALIESEDDLDPQKIREALSGNLCRCTGYAKIIEAVKKASLEQQSTTETSHG